MSLFLASSILVLSHIIVCWASFREYRKGCLPSAIQLIICSIIIFYDIGAIFDLVLNVPYPFSIISSFSLESEEMKILCFMILAISPWLIFLGAKMARFDMINIDSIGIIIEGYKAVIYSIIVVVICASSVVVGAKFITNISDLWSLRYTVVRDWGVYVILLYLPMYILSFQSLIIRMGERNVKLMNFKIFTFALTLSSFATLLIISQRTNIILATFFCIYSFMRQKLIKLVFYGLLIVIAFPVVLLPYMKWKASADDMNIAAKLEYVILGDLYRLPILAASIKESNFIGSKILPYPMAGYVYTLLFPVPRTLVNFKGESTAKYLTSTLAETTIDETGWGLGVGFIEEILLNVGFIFMLPAIVLYGFVFGYLDRLSKKYHTLIFPVRFCSLLLCGYASSALYLSYGFMAIISTILYRLLKRS